MNWMNERERRIRKRLRDDLIHYARKCLKIREKSGKIAPFELNRAQIFLHERLEVQKAKTGKVRALILKGRQQGISTYIGARFYHRTTHNRGLRVFILTHEQDATNNLFGMVERYHDHCPELVKPVTGAANAKELYFSSLESGYAVGTAGAKAVGRSQTIQLFHGSEAAFWPNAESHFAGVVQAIPFLDETEIILESTANGIGGQFHERWQQAEAGIGDYIAIFIPWFWQPEYTREVDAEFTLTDDEREYQAAHGLSLEQMSWRRAKIAELKDPLLFKQEYPANAAEAFQTTGHDSYIKPAPILAARKAGLEGFGPLIIGIDPSRFGDDKFAIAWRRGRKVIKVESKEKLDNVAGANWVRQIIDSDCPDAAFVDLGGQGAGVYDILKSWGGEYQRVTRPVNFGGSPQDDFILMPNGEKRPGPKNKRAEIWMRSKDWLDDPAGADIPDQDILQADACGPSYGYDVNQRLVLEGKEKMRARGVRSPDFWDAIALTFSETVSYREKRKPKPKPRSSTGGWMG